MHHILSKAIATLIFMNIGLSLSAHPLDELLERVENASAADAVLNQEREERFRRVRDQRGTLTKEITAQLATEVKREKKLQRDFSANEKKLALLQEELRTKLGTLGELMGVVRQTASDNQVFFDDSLISAQYGPDRLDFMEHLAASESVPKLVDLERLWFELHRELTASAMIHDFSGMVVGLDGRSSKETITRVGSFNLISKDKYLRYDRATNSIAELMQQPPARMLADLNTFVAGSGGDNRFFLDPSRGPLLEQLAYIPSLIDRFEMGGVVAWVILFVFVTGMILVIERCIFLSLAARRMKDLDDDANPIKMMIKAYDRLHDEPFDAVERCLDEVIVKTIPPLERGLKTIKVLAAVAPLLGLLGTVTGMIVTFQAITTMGASDPKLMAAGISQALITTVLGLIAAIPLLLFHNLLSSRSHSLVQIMDEQSAGIVAEHALAISGQSRIAD